MTPSSVGSGRESPPRGGGRRARRTAEKQGEVRDSHIEELAARVSKRRLNHYLFGITFHRLRSFTAQAITFDFPVTALVGPNGGGKSTVLNAAALVHEGARTSHLFPRGGEFDPGMQGWRIDYRLMAGHPKIEIERTVSYPIRAWSRSHAIQREILFFGVGRIIPANERPSSHRFRGVAFGEVPRRRVDDSVVREVDRILAKNVAKYYEIVLADDRDTFLVAEDSAGHGYSEFHFGAGEASILRLVAAIERAQDQALILVEEIENGLHPFAVHRLVEYLIMTAYRKRCQIIFTTHSNDALRALPPSAVWLAYDGTLTQGKLNVGAMYALTGRSSADLVIYVEDRFGEAMAYAALRAWAGGSVHLPSVEIYDVGGGERALEVHRHQEENPAISLKSVCIVDGDKRDQCERLPFAVAFPGDGAPEEYVLDSVLEELDDLLDALTSRLQLDPSRGPDVRRVLRKVARQNRDRHLVFGQIATDLGYLPQSVVEGAFLSLWTQRRPDQVEWLLRPLAERIPIVQRPM